MNLIEYLIKAKPTYNYIGNIGGKIRNANRRGSHKLGEPGTHSRKKLPKAVKPLIYTGRKK